MSVSWFRAPRAAAILELVREYQVEENVPADDVLRDVHEKYGKTDSVIRGFRAREDMTQIQLAKKLGVTQGGSLEDGEWQASRRQGDGPPAGEGVQYGLPGIYIETHSQGVPLRPFDLPQVLRKPLPECLLKFVIRQS